MTMHMGVVALASPLVAIGLAGSRFDPARRWPLVFAAVPASVVELVVVWAWHAPGMHHVARTSGIGLWMEQCTFLGCGLLLWIAAFGGERGGGRIGAGIVGLLLTSMHMTLLGALLALAPRPLYHHESAIGAWTALQDQQMGGAVMLLVGSVVYLVGGLALTAGLLRARVAPSGDER